MPPPPPPPPTPPATPHPPPVPPYMGARHVDRMLVGPLLVLLAASLALERPHLFAAAAVALAGTLAWDRIRRGWRGAGRVPRLAVRRLWPSRRAGAGGAVAAAVRRRYRITVGNLHPDRLASLFGPVLNMRSVGGVRDILEVRIKPYILRSGTAQNPRVLGMRSVLYPVAATVVAVPACIASLVLYPPAAAVAAAVPPCLAASYFVRLRFREDARRAGVEAEMAPFAALAGIMESVNIPLFSTLAMLAGRRDGPGGPVFSAMGREGRRLRDVMSLGLGPTAALMSVADSHPSAAFRGFVEGYVSAFNTGGADTAAYLQGQARRFFRKMQFGMESYAGRADTIAQVILTVMLLLPLMGISTVFFASGGTAAAMMTVMIMAFPFITVVLLYVVEAGQPRSMDGPVGTPWVVLPAAAGAAVATAVAAGDDWVGSAWQAVGAGIITGSFLNMALVGRRFSDAAQTDAHLPEFMRQMTRFKNIGVDIVQGVGRLRAEIVEKRRAGKHRFGRVFDASVDSVYRRMAAGVTVDAAVGGADIRSWNARLVFYMLGKVHESGGGTAKTLDDITRWVAEHAEARGEMVSRLRSSLATAFAGPVLMVMMASVADTLSSSLDGRTYPAGGSLTDPVSVGGAAAAAALSLQSAGADGLSELLTITAVACMGVVLSKLNYFTVRHTMFTGIITAVTMALTYAAPAITGVIGL